MKNFHTLFTLLCVLVAIGLSVLSWRQRQELVQLRATALDTGDRAALQKKLWDAEKRARDFEARALVAEASPLAKKSGGDKSNDDLARATAAQKKTTPSKLEILAFLNNPDTQRALNEKFRTQLDARYAVLFKALNLQPVQLAQFKDLLIERQSAAIDVAAAALSQNLNPNQDELRQLMSDAQTETDRKLEAALGATGYPQFQAYENAQLFRGATTNLQQGLSRQSAPLSDEQAEQFTAGIASLAQTSFTPAQQQALHQLTQLQQTRQTFQQAEQLYKDKATPSTPNGKK